jgi:hypothetical protein
MPGRGRYRSWSRIPRGVLLSVIGAVQYGTSKVFYKIVPHFDAQERCQYLHQVMATFGKIGTAVVRVIDRSGRHRAHKLAATLAHNALWVVAPSVISPTHKRLYRPLVSPLDNLAHSCTLYV